VRALIRLIRLIDRGLMIIETAGVIVSLGAMVLFAFLQVVLQHTRFGAPLDMQVVTRHLVIWVGMLGAALATADGKHISVEAVSKLVTPQGRRVIEGLVDAATVVVSLALARIAWAYIVMIERPEGTVLFHLGHFRFMRWWSLTILPVGFGLIAFRYFRLLLERIFVDEPVDSEAALAREISEYERRHSSGERPGAGTLP
jgi:TRAP-type C4-dicarboxylate transport system permease small subunit